MKLYWHLVLVATGGGSFALLGELVNRTMVAEAAWYHGPLVLPVYVALEFGKGGEDLNAFAGNLTWFIECLLFGLICDATLIFFRRSRSRNAKVPVRQ